MRNLWKFSSHFRTFSQVILLSLLSITFLVVGCAGPKPEEIVAITVDATSKVNTYKSDKTSDLLVSSLSDSSENQALIEQTISRSETAIVDIAGRKSYVFLKMPVMGVETLAESYVIEGYLYGHEDTRWVKLKIADDYWEAGEQLFLYIEMLQSASKVTRCGTERINGIDSYVIELAPRVEALKRESRSQIFGPLLYPAIGITEAFSFIDVPPPSVKVTATYWIDKSTFLFNQILIVISFNIDNKVENKNVDIKHEIRFNDYNKGVAISLPAEAQKAQEVSQ